MNLVESKMKDVGTVQKGAESNPETAEFRARLFCAVSSLKK